MDAAVQAGADAIGFVLYAEAARARHAGARGRAGAAAAALRDAGAAVRQRDAGRVDAALPRHAAAAAAVPRRRDAGASATRRAGPSCGRPACRRGFDLLDFARDFPKPRPCCSTPTSGLRRRRKSLRLVTHSTKRPLPLVLSGGLNPANVTDGVLPSRPWAVDVSSGVESAKGIKDAAADAPVLERCARPMRRRRRRSLTAEIPNTMLNYQQPDARGHFGPYGGSFVAETLIHALDELKAAYAALPQRPRVPGRVPARAGALRRPAQPGLPRRAH